MKKSKTLVDELSDLNSNALVTKEYFSYMVAVAISEYGISKVEFADEFSIATSTVDRWANGTAVPHPILRHKILEWIIDQKYN